MQLLAQAGLAGQMVAILRQELDSMVRVFYLLTQDLDRRAVLIEASVRGDKWTQPRSRGAITDKEMVELAQSLQGWARAVYKFGCAFVHLSGLHDYRDRDPLAQIPADERADILLYCRRYHGGPRADDSQFSDLVQYFPRVLEKIADNLEYYLEQLETGQVLNVDEI